MRANRRFASFLLVLVTSLKKQLSTVFSAGTLDPEGFGTEKRPQVQILFDQKRKTANLPTGICGLLVEVTGGSLKRSATRPAP